MFWAADGRPRVIPLTLSHHNAIQYENELMKENGEEQSWTEQERVWGTLYYYSRIFAVTDFSQIPFSLWKLWEINFYLCIWKTFSVPFYPSLFLLKKNISVKQRLPLPCPAWLYHGFASTGCKKLGKTCFVFWVQCTSEPWAQPCKNKDRRCPVTGVLCDRVPTLSPNQLTQFDGAQGCNEGSFSNKIAAFLCFRSPHSCVLRLPQQLQKIWINGKEWELSWCIYPGSARNLHWLQAVTMQIINSHTLVFSLISSHAHYKSKNWLHTFSKSRSQ